jgi:hypothetical protein
VADWTGRKSCTYHDGLGLRADIQSLLGDQKLFGIVGDPSLVGELGDNAKVGRHLCKVDLHWSRAKGFVGRSGAVGGELMGGVS